MKISRTVSLIAAAVVIVLLLGLTLRPKTAPAPVAADGIARTSPRELASMIARGEVIVIDVRDADAYIAGHIAGALHIPLSYIAGEVPYLRKGKRIVTYCTCPAEETSGYAALTLQQNGISSSALTGGLEAWQKEGGPVRAGRAP